MRRRWYDTQLSGTLPPSVGNLTALTTMCGGLPCLSVTAHSVFAIASLLYIYRIDTSSVTSISGSESDSLRMVTENVTQTVLEPKCYQQNDARLRCMQNPSDGCENLLNNIFMSMHN